MTTLLCLGGNVLDAGQLESHSAEGGVVRFFFRNGELLMIDFQNTFMAEQAISQIGLR